MVQTGFPQDIGLGKWERHGFPRPVENVNTVLDHHQFLSAFLFSFHPPQVLPYRLDINWCQQTNSLGIYWQKEGLSSDYSKLQ